MNRAFLIVALLMVSMPAFGQSPGGAWIADTSTGCKVWDSDPRPNQTVTWSGTCQNGFAQGFGTVQWFEDDKPLMQIEGDLQAGKLNGHGVEQSSDGSHYEGDFRDNKPSGHGVLRSADGAQYDGEIREDKANGHGVFRFANGNQYEGDFQGNKFSGHGVYTWTNGNRYSGQWQDGYPNGFGTYDSNDGRSINGTWVDGCLRSGNMTAAVAVPQSSCPWAMDGSHQGRPWVLTVILIAVFAVLIIAVRLWGTQYKKGSGNPKTSYQRNLRWFAILGFLAAIVRLITLIVTSR